MDDVPSAINLKSMEDAAEWERTALQKRPVRPEFFRAFANEIFIHNPQTSTILELGSGPGFLAQHLLDTFPDVTYVALDFSRAMHQLAQVRLGANVNRVRFVERSFKQADWTKDLGTFQCVVTNQAVHELRHKRYASTLHRSVKQILSPGGLYLVCDHFAGENGMKDHNLYMSPDEQRTALVEGGFSDPVLVKTADSLMMFKVHH